MKKKTDKDEKICWTCKRTLVEESKLGLCPNCLNKYGTPAAALTMLGLGFIGNQALKHSGKVVKVIANVIRYMR